MSRQKGFTLIELIVVIVILGILAATALPKFIDLSDDAKTAALSGVAGAISSASSVNYAGWVANSSKAQKTDGKTCSGAATAILQGGIPTGYTLDDETALAGDSGTSNNCTVTQTDGGKTSTATIITTK